MTVKSILSLAVILAWIFLSGSECIASTMNNKTIVRTPKIVVKVEFFSDKIVRIQKWTRNGTDYKSSLSVVMKSPAHLELTREDNDSEVTVFSRELKAIVSKANGSVRFISRDGSLLLQEDSSSFTKVSYGSDTAYSVSQSFELTPSEGIYGLGEDQHGYMNYRGRRVTLVQTNTNAVSPFLVSTMNYGLFWDNYSKTIFKDDGRKIASIWSDVADNIDYYFIAGQNIDSVISGYRKLTGEAPMYGKWAYGYWQSKEHYRTQDEVLSVAAKYRRLKMPIDNIIQDWDYWNGAKNWSGMYFDKTLYPHPKEMTDSLHHMNFHLMISIWPALGPNTEIYRDMNAYGFLYPPVGWGGFKYYDAYNPAADKLYWSYLKKGLLSKGVDAWWIDSTEPDLINANTVESTEYEMKRVGNTHLGSWARYLNPYSLVMTDYLYKAYRKDFSDKRFYILTRSTFAGQQRAAATTWTGDIGASWEIYRNQISAGINHCMSGIPYYTFDIGAFVLGAYGGVFNRGARDPAYEELYTRMFQFGAFCPIFRAHGSERPREIWEFADTIQSGETFSSAMLTSDNLRYRLMPYIYSLAWKVTSDGYTMMRGLPMDFELDTTTYSIDDEFMFGPSLLVCPVTQWMYYRPPEPSVLVGPEFFKTDDGNPGLVATYCSDSKHAKMTKQQIEPNVNINWYATGRPPYVTDSSFSIRWEGKLIPQETGKYQFHMRSYDAKRILLDGKELPIVYTSVEQYTDTLDLAAGREYKFVLETENATPGAAHMELNWKTPSIFAKEISKETPPHTKTVYLPKTAGWYDFWTAKQFDGGISIEADAPIDKIPLYVKAGSIIPLGPFMQYSNEKPADPIELRIYPGANANFTLYEDENDNYNYEKGIYSTIRFNWNDSTRTLTIGKREGRFPGMLIRRTFNLVIVGAAAGSGIEVVPAPTKIVNYDGKQVTMKF